MENLLEKAENLKKQVEALKDELQEEAERILGEQSRLFEKRLAARDKIDTLNDDSADPRTRDDHTPEEWDFLIELAEAEEDNAIERHEIMVEKEKAIIHAYHTL